MSSCPARRHPHYLATIHEHIEYVGPCAIPSCGDARPHHEHEQQQGQGSRCSELLGFHSLFGLSTSCRSGVSLGSKEHV